jgi:hypothetical protein
MERNGDLRALASTWNPMKGWTLWNRDEAQNRNQNLNHSRPARSESIV